MSTALNAFLPGPVSSAQTAAVLEKVWDHLPGSSETVMSAKKLGRIENVVWEPPELHFEIERHGAQQFGSKRAALDHWRLNIEKRTLVCSRRGIRQIIPMAPPLDVAPIVESVLASVRSGPLSNQGSDAVVWKGDRELRIMVDQLISSNGVPKQTLEGRRKRFRRLLSRELEAIGWAPIKGRALRFRRSAGDGTPADGSPQKQNGKI